MAMMGIGMEWWERRICPAFFRNPEKIVVSLEMVDRKNSEKGKLPQAISQLLIARRSASSRPSDHETVGGTRARRAIFARFEKARLELPRLKGHTNYGIAISTADIIEAIAPNTRPTLPVSVLVDGFRSVHNVGPSLPAVIGRSGIEPILTPCGR